MDYIISVKDKIVAHLFRNRHVNPNDIYNLPWDITQDGIASSLGITRAHASIELKRLKESAMVDEKQAHIKGGKVRRKCYMLTPLGLDHAKNILEKAESNNVDIYSMIDMKRQDPAMLLEGMTDADRYCLGCACTIRIPLHKSLLPNGGFSTMPLDVTGRTAISDLLRKNVLSVATPDELLSWHSFAADCWLDHVKELGDDTNMLHERLSHLVNAGRIIDACRLVSSHMHELISTTTDDLCETLQSLYPIPEKYIKDVISTRIEADIDTNDLKDVKKCIEILEGSDTNLAKMYSSDLAYINGDRKRAMEILDSMDLRDPMVNIRIARLMFEDGEYKGARIILNSLKGICDIGRVDIAVEKFILLARIDKAEGKDSDCYAHLMKARASVPEKGKRRIDLLIHSMIS